VLAWLGIAVASGAAATALVVRDPRIRAAAMLVALGLLPVLVVGDVWDTERVRELRDSPAQIAAVGIAAGVALVALTAAFLRWPHAFPILAFGTLAFRIPVELGGDTSNLLLPLYLVIGGGALAAAIGAAADRTAAEGAPGRAAAPTARSRSERGLEIATRALPWLFAGFLALYALQSAYSSDISKATETAAFFLIPFAALLVLLLDVRWTARLVAAVAIVFVAEALLFTAIAVWQVEARELFWNPTVIAGNEVHTYFRANSVFWDPNVLGRYLVLALLAAAAYMTWTRSAGRAVGAALACGVLLVGLTLSYSQSSVLALLAGLAVLVVPRWGLRWGAAVAAIAVTAAIAFALAAGIEPTSERSLEVRSSGRVTLVSGGLELAGDRPAYGFGSGSFQEEFTRRRFDVDQPRDAAISHAEPITVAAEQGAVGLLLYAGLLLAALVTLIAVTPSMPAARAALLAGFVAMVVHSLAYAGFLTDPGTWALLGLGLALARAPVAASADERVPTAAVPPPHPSSMPASSSASRPGAAGSAPGSGG